MKNFIILSTTVITLLGASNVFAAASNCIQDGVKGGFYCRYHKPNTNITYYKYAYACQKACSVTTAPGMVVYNAGNSKWATGASGSWTPNKKDAVTAKSASNARTNRAVASNQKAPARAASVEKLPVKKYTSVPTSSGNAQPSTNRSDKIVGKQCKTNEGDGVYRTVTKADHDRFLPGPGGVAPETGTVACLLPIVSNKSATKSTADAKKLDSNSGSGSATEYQNAGTGTLQDKKAAADSSGSLGSTTSTVIDPKTGKITVTTTNSKGSAPGTGSDGKEAGDTEFKPSDRDYRQIVGKGTSKLFGATAVKVDANGNQIGEVTHVESVSEIADRSREEAGRRQADLDKTRSDFKDTKPKLFGKREVMPTSDKDTSEHTSRQDYKQSKKDAKADRNSAEKIAKNDEKIAAKQLSQEEIRQVNESKDYGGKYGGESVEKTQNINATVKVISTIAEQKTNNVMQRQNTEVHSNYASRGMNATQQDGVEANAKSMENAVKANNTMGMATTLMGAFQGSRILKHTGSVKEVAKSAEYSRSLTGQDEVAAKAAITADYNSKCGALVSNPAAFSACNLERQAKTTEVEQKAAQQRENIKANQLAEKKAQGTAAFNQGLETAQTMAKAAGMYANARALKASASALRATSGGPAGGGFNYNPGAGNPNDPDGHSNTPPDNGGTVDNTTGDGPGLDPGNQQINPGLQDPGIGGAGGEGKFVAAPPPGGGAGGGGSLGSSGGTSAAKDDGAAKEGGPSKQQAGGGYASDGPAGGSGYRGSGSGAVGVDTSFADMLKKFLPGGEEDKKKDEKALAFDDRSPASDQAAVIGRNKNIFEEVHKRYQKKSGEGAIVF